MDTSKLDDGNDFSEIKSENIKKESSKTVIEKSHIDLL